MHAELLLRERREAFALEKAIDERALRRMDLAVGGDDRTGGCSGECCPADVMVAVASDAVTAGAGTEMRCRAVGGAPLNGSATTSSGSLRRIRSSSDPKSRSQKVASRSAAREVHCSRAVHASSAATSASSESSAAAGVTSASVAAAPHFAQRRSSRLRGPSSSRHAGHRLAGTSCIARARGRLNALSWVMPHSLQRADAGRPKRHAATRES